MAPNLRLLLYQPPEPLHAGIRILAGAGAGAAAGLVAAEAERAEKITLRAPHQIGAPIARQRPPLFARQAAGKFLLPAQYLLLRFLSALREEGTANASRGPAPLLFLPLSPVGRGSRAPKVRGG